MRTSFEISFNQAEIDHKLYPEATMYSKNTIVVDADSKWVITSGKDQVTLCINGNYKVYTNVWAVAPYYYQEG